MPQQSKYSNQVFDTLTNDLITALEKNNADRDLSLMVLGNVITNIFQQQVKPGQRQKMAEQFTQILLKSVSEK